MRYILDTSAFSRFTDSKLSTTDLNPYFTNEHSIVLPTVVLAELRAGYKHGSKTAENEQQLQRFIDSPNVEVLTITEATTKNYANLYYILRTRGTPVGVNDMWIAALCFEHDLPLLTCDSDFSRIPDLLLA